MGIGAVSNSTVDLSKCKKGDILISTHGAKLEYIAPTPWKHYTYLDHVVRYIEDVNGKSFGKDSYGTRTNDGFTYAKKRKPETDHDIAYVVTPDMRSLLIKLEILLKDSKSMDMFYDDREMVYRDGFENGLEYSIDLVKEYISILSLK